MSHPKTSWPAIGLLSGAVALALVTAVPAATAAPADRHHGGPAARRLHQPGRHLRGEPLVRQPLRPVGPRRRAGRRRPPERRRHHDPGRPGRHALRLPAAERRQPHLAVAPRHHVHRPRPRRAGEPLRQQLVHHRQLHPADRHDLPGPRRLRPQRGAQRHRCRGRLHPRPRPPLLPGAVPDRRRQAGPLRHRLRRGRASPWAATRRRRCRSTAYLHSKGAPNYVVADRFFQARLRRLVPQPPVPHRGACSGRHRWRHPDGGQLDRRRQRDADVLPPLHRHVAGQGRPAHPGLQQRQAVRLHARPAATSPSTPCSRRALRPVAARRSRSSTTPSTPTSATG